MSKLIFTKDDLLERYAIKSWNTFRKKIINTGILPQGKPVHGGIKLYWKLEDVEQADKKLLDSFNQCA